ncbi:hypothetical protein TRVL_05251 [Trypanosoma vivax]|nr:hypothetical protein TRVL_05251 [Trypanosoma vivax]
MSCHPHSPARTTNLNANARPHFCNLVRKSSISTTKQSHSFRTTRHFALYPSRFSLLTVPASRKSPLLRSFLPLSRFTIALHHRSSCSHRARRTSSHPSP